MNSIPHDSTQIQNDDISGETSVRIIPGPAGVYQRPKIRKIADTREGRDVSTDTTQEYMRKVVADLSAVDYANANGWVVNGCLGDIKSYIKKGKVDLVLAIIKSCTPNALGDLTVTLKDLSGSLSGTIHHKIINEGGYGKDINVGAALILRNISVFSPKSGHYLNITMKNLVKVFKKDTPPGSSGILDEEEIMKLLEEEEMSEIELQLLGNVNDDEIQHTQDEEAFNLALEEEARYARIDQERLQQEEEETKLWYTGVIYIVSITLSSSSCSSISVFYDSSNSESSSDENLTQILQRCDFQQYDSTSSENLNYDDPPISDEVIEAVPLQMILPTEPSSSDENLTQILQRCDFQQYDSTSSENLNYDDPPISDEVIEAVPLQMILPTEPVPANNTGLALPVPIDQSIPSTPTKKRKIDQDIAIRAHSLVVCYDDMGCSSIRRLQVELEH
ncbi:hypothetical protein CTI12_AA186470 [Artemisia annua]|uniref:Homologous recombination OB-fold protein OB-fold domain-containing protein n=1 Tax=Artemisia annua TaxID=35608 RepID=A0A2U1P746_ARTAN|nr:hypothetical protein CTI12_AA186470 [Artemisia annua]